MKLKRWTAMLLCVLLCVQLSSFPTQAAGDVYFTGVQENILALSDDTMPFWRNNYLYVPVSIFSGSARNSLEVGYSVASNGSWVALYWGERAILYRKDLPYGEDQNGKRYYPSVVERNGALFVPAGVVAEFFGLQYSVSTVNHGSLVWLHSKNFGLDREEFLNAAEGVMNWRYEEYMAGKITPLPPEEENQPEEAPSVSGKKLYLCARATEDTAALLDLLDRNNSYMTFYCTPEFMAENHDLLRRMVGTGHSVGILAEEGEDLPPVKEQVAAANRALETAAYTKTRLVRVENASLETAAELAAGGYCTSISSLKRSADTLSTSIGAEALFRSLSTTRKTAVVWLDDRIGTSGMLLFLSRAKWAEDECLPLRETTDIFA